MRVAHFVSGFPVLSETFVLDEIQAFGEEGFSNILVSLRPSHKGLENPLELLPSDRSPKDLNIKCVLYPDRFLQLAELNKNSQSSAQIIPESLSTIQWDLILAGLCHLVELPKMLVTARRIGQLKQVIRELGIDHCHAHFAHYPTDLAWGCSGLLGVTFSFNAHSYDFRYYQAHKSQRVRSAHRIFPISILARDHLQGFLPTDPLDPEKIQVIHCGIRLDEYQFDPGTKWDRSSPPILVGVGRLTDSKGFRDLILAGKILSERGIDHEIRIIGEGPERTQLEELAQQGNRGLSKVRFLGSLPRCQVREHQHQASVVVQPSCPGKHPIDGIPVVIMEAMALGTPVVSTNFSSIPELVEHEEEGLLVEPHHPLELADAIQRILENDSLKASLVHRARKKIESEFDAGRNYRHKASLIRELILTRSSLKPVKKYSR